MINHDKETISMSKEESTALGAAGTCEQQLAGLYDPDASRSFLFLTNLVLKDGR